MSNKIQNPNAKFGFWTWDLICHRLGGIPQRRENLDFEILI